MMFSIYEKMDEIINRSVLFTNKLVLNYYLNTFNKSKKIFSVEQNKAMENL